VEHLNRSDGIVAYEPDTTLANAAIVDIDSSLARLDSLLGHDTTRRRKGLEYRLAELLDPFTHSPSTELIILTGRGEECRGPFLESLSAKNIPHGEVHMRRRGDSRRNQAVKLELFNRHVRHRFNVVAAFADREQAIPLWRRLGLLTCALQ
jgi:hypothetical protein